MHLTGGQFKGRIVPMPCGGEYERTVKPTLSKVRESVFNILSSHFLSNHIDFSNLSFLDMFSGSGIMALEAYSRGFEKVFAIEKNPKTYFSIQKTFSVFDSNIELLKGDSLKIINKLEDFDIIYIDPPWDFEYEFIIKTAHKKLSKNGIMIVEYDKKDIRNLNKKSAKSSCQRKEFNDIQILPFKEKIYGRCKLDFYTK